MKKNWCPDVKPLCKAPYSWHQFHWVSWTHIVASSILLMSVINRLINSQSTNQQSILLTYWSVQSAFILSRSSSQLERFEGESPLVVAETVTKKLSDPSPSSTSLHKLCVTSFWSSLKSILTLWRVWIFMHL
jgi:hypothetical protein